MEICLSYSFSPMKIETILGRRYTTGEKSNCNTIQSESKTQGSCNIGVELWHDKRHSTHYPPPFDTEL